ncbi:MAG: HvfC family RiPP maturation protein [Gammaproteobacteria bacterium]
MAEKLPKFQQVQYQFTRHMRDPENNPAFDDIEARRIKVYADLLFNNVKNFLENSFPVLSSVIEKDRWNAICRDYFKRHQARTPLFPKMPQEFLHYLAEEYEAQENDYPFVHELAHYEWLEVETLLDEQEIDSVETADDVAALDGIPILNPLARAQAYSYPVHRISKDYLPGEAPDNTTYLIVYRDRADKVGFMEINPITARLIELISRNDTRSARQLLDQIAVEMGHQDPKLVVEGGADIMEQLLEKDVLLGAIKQ